MMIEGRRDRMKLREYFSTAKEAAEHTEAAEQQTMTCSDRNPNRKREVRYLTKYHLIPSGRFKCKKRRERTKRENRSRRRV
jgi:hypothetical protein